MAGSTTKKPAASKTAAPKKRTVKTDAERIADAEAKLAALREKAAKKSSKVRDDLVAKRDAKVAKRDALEVEIRELNNEIDQLGDGTTPDPDPVVSQIAADEADES
jgi:uncharacterized coiled-coil DUF342 family protein